MPMEQDALGYGLWSQDAWALVPYKLAAIVSKLPNLSVPVSSALK